MPCTTIKFDGITAIVKTGKPRAGHKGAWLRCDERGCKRDAQWLCKTCGALVCGRHGVAPSEEEQYCLKCADAAGVAGMQRDLFQSVRPSAKARSLDGLDKQRG